MGSVNERTEFIVKTIAIPITPGTKSDAIEKLGMALVGIQTPAALTSTAMTFEGSADGVTFEPVFLFDGSSAYPVVVAGHRYISINPEVTKGIPWLKLVMGTAEAAARTVLAVFRVVA
jgi:hypothetical protein